MLRADLLATHGVQPAENHFDFASQVVRYYLMPYVGSINSMHAQDCLP